MEIIVDKMTDKEFNPYEGSVSLEKVQNAITHEQGSLLKLVLHGRTFSALIKAYPDLFVVFTVESSKMRMRYHAHAKWEEGDRQARAERYAENSHFEKVLSCFLWHCPNKEASVDAFMKAYPDLPYNVSPSGKIYPLPKRGDLVRLIRHKTRTFSFEGQNSGMANDQQQSKHIVRLASGALPPMLFPSQRA